MKRLALLVLLSAGVAGCSAFSNLRPGTNQAKISAQHAHDMQFKVMRFADEYAGSVIESMGRLQKTSPTAEERLGLQTWKHQQVEAAYLIGSGPNWVANSIDMVVLSTLTRMVLEDVWVRETLGERAKQVLETHLRLEAQSWELVAAFPAPTLASLRWFDKAGFLQTTKVNLHGVVSHTPLVLLAR